MSAKCFFHFKWIQNAVDQDRSSELKLIEMKKTSGILYKEG